MIIAKIWNNWKINLIVGELKTLNNQICSKNILQYRTLEAGSQLLRLYYEVGTIWIVHAKPIKNHQSSWNSNDAPVIISYQECALFIIAQW